MIMSDKGHVGVTLHDDHKDMGLGLHLEEVAAESKDRLLLIMDKFKSAVDDIEPRVTNGEILVATLSIAEGIMGDMQRDGGLVLEMIDSILKGAGKPLD